MKKMIPILLCLAFVFCTTCLAACQKPDWLPELPFWSDEEPTEEVTDPTDSVTEPTEVNFSMEDANAPDYIPEGTFGAPAAIDDYVIDSKSVQMSVPKNLLHFGKTDLKLSDNKGIEEATVLQYVLCGNIVNWRLDNGYLYVITKASNSLVVLRSATMELVGYAPLNGSPAEMNFVGDCVYISLPELHRIDIFRKVDCAPGPSIRLEEEVSSFQIAGNYLFYSEHDQHCRIFRLNMRTGEKKQYLKNYIDNRLYYPKIILNKTDFTLLAGETNSSRSSIYYLDAKSMDMISSHSLNGYNLRREMFLFEDKVYWSNLCLGGTANGSVQGKYTGQPGGSNGIGYVSENWVITGSGLFRVDTYELIADFVGASLFPEHMLISEADDVIFFTSIRNAIASGTGVINVLHYTE